MRTANRIVLNSIALYFNMAVTLLATLLSTRFVLQALGSVEYGAYALVTNLVAMFSFLNVAMTVATQRFLSYAIGENNVEKTKEVFYCNLIIHIAIAVILVVLMLLIGTYVVSNLLDVPEYLSVDVMAVFLFMVMGSVFMILSVPYEGAMNAHEDLVVIAAINIIDAITKLFSAIFLLFITDNKMIIYAFLVMLSSVLAFFLKRSFSRRKYEETIFVWHRIKDYKLIKEIVNFASWNLIGAGSSLAKYQGVALLLNKFFGLVANAAYGLSQQLNGFLLFFANSTLRPMRPQIVKSAAIGMHKQMVNFAYTTTKFTFLLLCLLVVPIYINLPFVLELWLVSIPDDTILFCRGFLVMALMSQLSVGYQIGLESCGKVKKLQMIVGTMHFVPLLVGYIFFRYGCPPLAIIVCLLVEEVICLIIRMVVARVDADMPIMQYLKTLLLPCLLVIAVAVAVTFGVSELDCFDGKNRVAHFITTFMVNAITMLSLGYFFCLTPAERASVKGIILSIERKLKHPKFSKRK